MNKIVERLRTVFPNSPSCQEAADEIERLEREAKALRVIVENERELKQGWIDEYVKLRDMREMPDDEAPRTVHS